MLKSTVPTCAKLAVCAGGEARSRRSRTRRRSGSSKRTALFQLRPSSSSHWLVAGLNFTIRPTSGPRDALEVRVRRRQAARHSRRRTTLHGRRAGAAVADDALGHRRRLVAGVEDGGVDGVAVGLTASARGVSPKSVDDARAACRRASSPRFVASNTQTSARPMPAVVSCGSTGAVLPAVRRRDEGAVAARCRRTRCRAARRRRAACARRAAGSTRRRRCSRCRRGGSPPTPRRSCAPRPRPARGRPAPSPRGVRPPPRRRRRSRAGCRAC